MRNSNKLLALALAAALTLGTTATAFAVDETSGNDGGTPPTGTSAPADEDKKDETESTEAGDKEDATDSTEAGDKEDATDSTEAGDKEDATDSTEAGDKEDATDSTEAGDKEDATEPTEDNTPAAVTYTDVGDRWFAGAVGFVTEKKLMDGLTETTFGPDEKMTRQMLAVALYRLAGSPEVTAENPFTDVAADAAYKDAVVWAYSVGVVNGVTDTTFGPDSNIQRQAIAAMLARYLGVDTTGETDLSAFTDADAIQDYAKAAMSWAAKNELLKGDTKGAVDPRGDATRAQVATILERFAPMAEGKAPTAAPADDANAPADDANAPADEDKKDDAATPADEDKKDDAATPADEDKKDDAATPADEDKKDDAATPADEGKKDDASDADKADDADKTGDTSKE